MRLKNITDDIFLKLVDNGLTVKEAIKVLQTVDGKVRKIRARMADKVEGASLKEAQKVIDD